MAKQTEQKQAEQKIYSKISRNWGIGGKVVKAEKDKEFPVEAYNTFTEAAKKKYFYKK